MTLSISLPEATVYQEQKDFSVHFQPVPGKLPTVGYGEEFILVFRMKVPCDPVKKLLNIFAKIFAQI